MTDITYITYEEFKARVKAIVFPEGEAENLVGTHNSYIDEALINLQTHVACLRENNVDIISKEDVREQCNADFINGPRGVIQSVYAFLPGTECRRYFYDPKSPAFIDCWMARQSCTTCGTQSDDGSPSIARSPECHTEMAGDTSCYDPYEQASENDAGFKIADKFYAAGPNNRMIFAPRFPCGYKMAVHYEGIKRVFSDADPLPDDMDLITTVAKYVECQRAGRLDKDQSLYATLLNEFNKARAGMIVRCVRERRVPDKHQCNDNFDVTGAFQYDPMLASQDRFAYLADWGQPGVNLTAVNSLISGWNPDFIVSGGDNKYSVTMAQALAAAPYLQSQVDNDLFYPAIGNHDLSDGGGLADFLSVFSYINYTAYRNYSIRKKHVEFFFMETHDTGTAPPDLDAQASWLAASLAASTARFKVVVTQDPPFCSDEGSNYPGHTPSRLDYAGLGADVVLSGDSHYYERLLVDGFNYVICGLGGATKNGFNAVPVDGSLVRYNDLYGAIRGTATNNELKLEFINTAGQLVDRLILRK